MPKLNTYVHVHGPEGSVAFGPGDDVPEWAAEKITRDDVWASEDDTQTADGDEDSTEPPRAGRGSGEDAWRAFAAAKEVELPEDLESRDDIVAYLEAEGVIDPADA